MNYINIPLLIILMVGCTSVPLSDGAKKVKVFYQPSIHDDYFRNQRFREDTAFLKDCKKITDLYAEIKREKQYSLPSDFEERIGAELREKAADASADHVVVQIPVGDPISCANGKARGIEPPNCLVSDKPLVGFAIAYRCN